MSGIVEATATLSRGVASGPGYLRLHCVIPVAGNCPHATDFALWQLSLLIDAGEGYSFPRKMLPMAVKATLILALFWKSTRD